VEEALAFQGRLDGNERGCVLLPGYKEDEAV
jgi:hypothetical protein